VAVHLHDERTFDAPAAALFELMIDPAFQEARSRHLGTRAARCQRSDEGAATVIALDETRDTGFAQHAYRTLFLARWDREAMRARWELRRIEGPGDAQAHGTIEIDALGADRSRLIMDGELEVRVRFFGVAIERVAKSALGIARAKEARFIASELARRR
jgi:hypothetical protein